jgi:hypothetical protein
MTGALLGFPIDAYQIETLEREYEILNPKERIDFLKALHQQDELPFELASLAVRDPIIFVRAWAAKHLYLDYREDLGRTDGAATDEFPERNLFVVLEADREPLVRAALYENESFFGPGVEEKNFVSATQLERLGIIRRGNMDRDLVKRIFEPEDTKLGIEPHERKELAVAFLRKRADGNLARKLAKRFREAESRASMPLEFADTAGWELEELWTLVLRWPEDSGLQTLIFKHVNASDEIIEGVYGKCDRPEWRYAVLKNDHHFSDPWHNTVSECKVLQLAVDDKDPAVRKAAYEQLNLQWNGNRKYLKETEKAVQKSMRGKDEPSIRGLLRNSSLPAKLKKQIAKQFRGLYQREEDRLAEFAWRKSRYPKALDEGPLRWTWDQKINELWHLSASDVFAATRMRDATSLAGLAGLAVAVVAYLITWSLSLSFFLFAFAIAAGAVAAQVVDSRRYYVPLWLTFEEWAEQWAPFDSWAERISRRAKETTSRETDFFETFWDYGHDPTPAERAAYDLCRNATIAAEKNCFRDYINELDRLGGQEVEKAFSARTRKNGDG